jgi:integrase
MASPYQRTQDGMWCVAIELPSTNGDRRRKYIVRKYKKDVLAERTRLLKQFEKSGDLPTSSQTVAQWFDYWLRAIVAKEVRPKTAANYRTFSKRIVKVIGTTRLDKLSPAHIRKVDDAIEKELSSTSAATAHRIMSSAFAAAEREGRLENNPAKLARAPRVATPTLEVLTVDEVIRLLGLFDDGTEKVMWFTYLMTGARRGEILGLEWDRVSDVLDLSWQMQRHPVEMVAPADYEYRRVDGGLYLTRPKSKAGWRIVPLVEPLSGVLRRWHEAAPVNPHGLLFATPEGKPFDPDHISKTWPNVLKAAGIEKKVRLHDLRHTAVDMLYEAGVNEQTITEIVGHSSRSMTRAYKSRGNRPQLTDAMKRMSALLGIEANTADSSR